MSKRAEDLAKQLYPDPKLEDYDDILVYRADRDNTLLGRINVVRVYEQAEKDTLERAIEWWRPRLCGFLKEGLTEGVLEEFRNAMEEE